MGVLLDGYPWWNQLTDPAPGTGEPDQFASADCGEECASIVIMGRTGKYTSATEIRRAILGHGDHGETTAQDLAGVLIKYGVPADIKAGAFPALRQEIKARLDVGLPVIVLGYWWSPVILHWVVALGHGNDAMAYMDPWDGKMHVMRWRMVHSLAVGTIVRVTG